MSPFRSHAKLKATKCALKRTRKGSFHPLPRTFFSFNTKIQLSEEPKRRRRNEKENGKQQPECSSMESCWYASSASERRASAWSQLRVSRRRRRARISAPTGRETQRELSSSAHCRPPFLIIERNTRYPDKEIPWESWRLTVNPEKHGSER